jgi:hypothetical protein
VLALSEPWRGFFSIIIFFFWHFLSTSILKYVSPKACQADSISSFRYGTYCLHKMCFFVSDIDECMSDPCQNNGTCTDQINAYKCQCVLGFNGTNCENSMFYQLYINVILFGILLERSAQFTVDIYLFGLFQILMIVSQRFARIMEHA